MPDKSAQRSSSLALGLTWSVVVLPTLWGLTYTVENALKLFRNQAPAVTVPASQVPGR